MEVLTLPSLVLGGPYGAPRPSLDIPIHSELILRVWVVRPE